MYVLSFVHEKQTNHDLLLYLCKTLLFPKCIRIVRMKDEFFREFQEQFLKNLREILNSFFKANGRICTLN